MSTLYLWLEEIPPQSGRLVVLLCGSFPVHPGLPCPASGIPAAAWAAQVSDPALLQLLSSFCLALWSHLTVIAWELWPRVIVWGAVLCLCS